MVMRKANVTDLARFPFYPLRYYIMTENTETQKTGMYKTHRTAEAAFRTGFTHFRVVDLKDNYVSTPYPIKLYGKYLLTEWRKHYFDENFDLITAVNGFNFEEEDPDEE